jgi:acyl transferase domain-containing protein
LRRDQGGYRQWLTALAGAFTAGLFPVWEPERSEAQGIGTVDLPTYAFQEKSYWLDSPVSSGDATGLGLAAADHPLLLASVTMAGGQGLVFTGRLSLATHPWLADHAVMGTVLLPGTAFVELALYAGEQADCTHLEELTLEAPLVLPDQGQAAAEQQIAQAGQSVADGLSSSSTEGMGGATGTASQIVTSLADIGASAAETFGGIEQSHASTLATTATLDMTRATTLSGGDLIERLIELARHDDGICANLVSG